MVRYYAFKSNLTNALPLKWFFLVSGYATYQALIVRPERLDNSPDYFLDQGGTTPVIRAYAISCPICSFA